MLHAGAGKAHVCASAQSAGLVGDRVQHLLAYHYLDWRSLFLSLPGDGAAALELWNDVWKALELNVLGTSFRMQTSKQAGKIVRQPRTAEVLPFVLV